jgi:hypothetical protein
MNEMKMMIIGVMLFFGIGLARSCPALPQQGGSPSLPLSNLKASDWEQRRDAFEKIKGNQEALRRSDVKMALVDLLDRENQMIHKTLVDSKGKVGASGKYGEEYSEYNSELLGTIEKIADWNDQHQLCVLAGAAYEPDSPFAARLAAEGKAGIVPCLVKRSQGNMFDRHESIPVLVQLSAITKDLSPTVRQQIRQTIIAGLRDSEVFVRQPTVEAVGKFGTPELIPTLEEIARSDPYSRPLLDGSLRFDIREAAAKAVQSIQERAKAY